MTSNVMTPGFHVTGEFLSLKRGRSWKGRDGETREPWDVRLLVGDRTERVQFASEDAARATIGDPERGEMITLEVYANAKGDGAWLQLAGRSPRAGE